MAGGAAVKSRVTIYRNDKAASGDILALLIQGRHRPLTDDRFKLLCALADGHLHDIGSTLPGMIGDPTLSVVDLLRRLWSITVLARRGLIAIEPADAEEDRIWTRITRQGLEAMESR